MLCFFNSLRMSYARHAIPFGLESTIQALAFRIDSPQRYLACRQSGRTSQRDDTVHGGFGRLARSLRVMCWTDGEHPSPDTLVV